MLNYHLLAIGQTCQLAIWDIVDLGVGVARRRHRALRCGDRAIWDIVDLGVGVARRRHRALLR